MGNDKDVSGASLNKRKSQYGMGRLRGNTSKVRGKGGGYLWSDNLKPVGSDGML